MDFNDVNVKEFVKGKFNTKVYVENDTHCAGLAERYFGNGKKHKNFVVLTIGTGIGGAIFIDGKLYRGQGIGAEPGQMLMHGKRFEELASGNASVKIAEKYSFKNINSMELESLARKKNQKALEVYKEVGRNLGIGLLNISYLLDPEIIIIGGGFSKVEFIYEEANKVLHENDLAKRNIKIVRTKLGDNAGLIGAALLEKLKLF